MTTGEKAEKVFQSGIAFLIWNKPVQNDQLWDIKLFWMSTMNSAESLIKCADKGYDNLDDCLDDMLKYLEEHE